MGTKQSSIEWLVDELTSLGHNFKLYKKEIEQAKEMHKQEIIEAKDDGYNDAEQYYNETFGK